VKSPFDCHHEAVTIRGHGVEQRFRSRFPVAVHEDCPGMVHDPDGQAPGMQVDAAVILVWVGVEAPEVSSSSVSRLSQCQQSHGGMLRGETSISIKALEPTASSVRSFLAPASGGGSPPALGFFSVRPHGRPLAFGSRLW
jgi:hypothetical protein